MIHYKIRQVVCCRSWTEWW